VPAAATAATKARMAKTLSTVPIVCGLGAATGAEGRCEVAAGTPVGRWVVIGAGAPAARGAAGAAAGAAAAEGAPDKGTPVGPPGGSVGNLIVGAAEGFGGKLMRTVSFLGCTLPVDFFIGSAPWGAPGMFEGISAISLLQDNLAQTTVKLLINKTRPAPKFSARFLPNAFLKSRASPQLVGRASREPKRDSGPARPDSHPHL